MNSKEDVIRIASQLFSKKGYYGTSIRDIAKECGLSSSSLYSHINSKEEILFEIVVNKAGQGFVDAIKPISDSREDPLKRLRQAILTHIDLLCNHIDTAKVFLAEEWKMLPDEKRFLCLKKREEYEACWLKILEDGIKEGVIKKERSELTFILIMSAVNWVYQWYKPTGPFKPEQIADDFYDKILYGIAMKQE